MTVEPRRIKLLMIGDTGVGKTSLLDVFTRRGFSIHRLNTIGVDFASRIVEIDGIRIKLEIWDTAGQERYRSIPISYYRDVDGVILAYDVTNKESFYQVHNWMLSLNLNEGKTAVKMLVGNKCDIRSDLRVVSTIKGIAMAEQYGLKFFETSAKANLNVEESFMTMAKDVNDHINVHGRRRRPDSIRIHAPPLTTMQRLKYCFC